MAWEIMKVMWKINKGTISICLLSFLVSTKLISGLTIYYFNLKSGIDLIFISDINHVWELGYHHLIIYSKIIKSIIRSFIMLNTIMKSENKTFTTILIFSEIIIADQGSCDTIILWKKTKQNNRTTFGFAFCHSI